MENTYNNKKTLTKRIIVAKAVAFIFAVIYIATFVTQTNHDLVSKLSLGTLLVCMTMGLVIALAGVFAKHPFLGFQMKWYLRGAFLGTLIIFMFVLLSYDAFKTVIDSPLISWMGIESPYWAVIDGTIMGLIIDFVATKMAGEGRELEIS
ncbi:hypothetical protein CSB11_02655 [Candidatus Campbellbacteria bacterium]|nr:MAG: hypothetical protein CSB11_02655 [Candidatus Campbellbacteria bacterium]